MTKTDIISNVAEKTGVSKKDTEKVFKGILDEITSALANKDKVQIPGFGTFDTVKRNARTGRNPINGNSVEIPEKTAPKFKPGKALKDAVNG